MNLIVVYYILYQDLHRRFNERLRLAGSGIRFCTRVMTQEVSDVVFPSLVHYAEVPFLLQL